MTLRYPVTIAIIIVNVVVFIVIAWQLQDLMMRTNRGMLTILDAGANLNPFTLGGQPWRIITGMFLHFGVFHLLVNMYGLFSLGQYLEPAIGKTRFFLLYMICGVAAGLASLQFNVFVISAGASGAIFGLYGYHLGASLISSYNDWDELKIVLINFVIFVVINAMVASWIRLDLSGHIGGALMGFVLSFCHNKLDVLESKMAMVLFLLCMPLAIFAISDTQVKYYQLYQRVIATEKRMKAIFGGYGSDRMIADSLVIVQEKFQEINNDLSRLRPVPAKLQQDTSTFRKYVDLQAEGIRYRIALLREHYTYVDSLDINEQKLNEVPRLQYILNYTWSDAVEEVPDTLNAQAVQQPIQVLYDKNWRETVEPAEAKYYRVGIRDSLGRWQGEVRDYYSNGDLQMRGRYTDNLRDGIFVYYSDHATYTSAGRYKREHAVGRWESYHWNGKLEAEMYREPEYFMNMMWDSLGQTMVSGGNGEYKKWYANGNLRERGNYVQGKREGFWFGYHENGQPYFKEQYRNGRMISGASENKEGKRFVYDQLSELPFPKIGMQAYRNYIDANKRIPPGPVRQGIVKVIFTVGTDGSLWDFIILEGIWRDYDEEAIRLIREGPAWRPAFLHGDQPVQSEGYIEVSF